jgi:hypothetical protein
MDREQPHGPGIVHEKVVHTETRGGVSHARRGEIDDNRSARVSNQLSQTVVTNAKTHWKLSESNGPPTGWKHVHHTLNHVSHQFSNLAMAVKQLPTPSGSLRYLFVSPLFIDVQHHFQTHYFRWRRAGSLQWTTVDGFGQREREGGTRKSRLIKSRRFGSDLKF